MKRILFIFNILIGIVFTSFAQNVTVSGYIENKATGERLIMPRSLKRKAGGEQVVTDMVSFHSPYLVEKIVYL